MRRWRRSIREENIYICSLFKFEWCGREASALRNAKDLIWVTIRKMLHILTSIIVTHSDVMTNHVRHRSGQQMGFVHIYVDADANRFVSAYRFWHGHACFTTGKCLSAMFVCVWAKIKGKNKSTNGIMECRRSCASLPQKNILTTSHRILYEYLYAQKEIFFWNTFCTHVRLFCTSTVHVFVCISLAIYSCKLMNKTKTTPPRKHCKRKKSLFS